MRNGTTVAIGKQSLETPLGGIPEPRAEARNPQMSLRDWLSLGLLSMIWGGSFFFAKVAVEDIGPLTVVLGRVSVAAVILNLLVVSRGWGMPRSVAGWKPFIVMGVLNSIVPYSLIFWGEIHIASGLAAILNATTPLFTMLVAHVATADERLSPAKVAGVLLGLLGVIVIMGRDLFEIASSNGLAQLAVLAASLSYGISGVYGRRLRGTPPMVSAGGQMTAATVMLAPIALLIERPWANATPDADSVASVLALAILSTAIAYLIFFRILASAGASNVSLVTLLVPVSSLTLGALFLSEPFVIAQLGGMLLIATGLLLIDGRLVRRFRQPRPAITTS